MVQAIYRFKAFFPKKRAVEKEGYRKRGPKKRAAVEKEDFFFPYKLNFKFKSFLCDKNPVQELDR